MKNAVILFSGGLDSTTCLAYAKSQGFFCHALSFSYGQKHHAELNAAKKIAAVFNVPHKIFNLEINQFGGSALTDGNLSSAEFEASNNERLHGTRSKTKYEIDSNWGISILPGILYSDTTLFFARVGYASGNFRIRTTDISLKNADTWLDGIRFGLGIEKNIYPQLDVRMEYNHFIYEDHTQTTFDPVGEVTKRTQVSPTTNQVEFAVVYRFC